MDAPPAPVVQNLQTLAILSESTRFIAANFHHFLALSLLVLLPLITLSSFSSFIYWYISVEFTRTQIFFGTKYHPTDFTYADAYHVLLRLPFLYTLLISPITLFAFTVINHYTFHRFHGRPLDLTTFIDSLSSYVPLLFTFYVAQFCQLFISLFTTIFLFRLTVQGFENLGFEVYFNSDDMKFYYVLLKVVIQCVFIFFQVIWILAPVIVIAESKWGLGPLWRSFQLIKGMKMMKSVPLLLILCYGVIAESVYWLDLNTITPVLMTLVLLHFSVSINVLYKHCKA